MGFLFINATGHKEYDWHPYIPMYNPLAPTHMMKDTLTEKVALVTGAGSGLGKAAAKALSYAGASVALVGRTADELEVTREEILHHGGQAITILADVSNNLEMEAAFARVEKQWNRLDIVFANAGINGVWAPLENIEEDDWDKTLTINLKGTFLTLKHAVPLMKQSGGSIIITSSINGTRVFSNTGGTAYACSKAGQMALAKMLALELAKFRIRVNVICPGAIESKIDDSTTKMGLENLRLPSEFPEGVVPLTGGVSGSAGEVAQLVWFLASDAASHITGTEVYIDGAQSLLQG